MSLKFMVQAFDLEISNPTAKLVLLKLADNANDTGYCFPSIEYIAKQCSVHPRTVKRQIKSLVELGYIEVTPRFNNNKQRSNEYLLHLYSPIKSGGDKLPSHKAPEEPIASNKEQVRGDTRSPIGVTEDHPESIDLSNRNNKILCSSTNEQLEDAFDHLWKRWPAKKNKIGSKQAFKAKMRGKSPDSVNKFVDMLKNDIQGRLAAKEYAFEKRNLEKWLKQELWNNVIEVDEVVEENLSQAELQKIYREKSFLKMGLDKNGHKL